MFNMQFARDNANVAYSQKRTRRAKGFADLKRTGDQPIQRYKDAEWQYILSKPQYHSPEVSPERGTGNKDVLVYDIAERSEEVSELNSAEVGSDDFILKSFLISCALCSGE